ncbi:CPBP family intramembrane glutamic endopeptidase [Flavobacterium psychrotrophum]|uniref:CPBP family intramembrane glutamic endopeptidase n=1 Tax=Flavobacterium psychrotrophum TaxID=2294119 RepID=UPI000E30B46C|nr:CPBP family intramembrane glutamic endopeptidase [Flavobacterium psychrotrophum]
MYIEQAYNKRFDFGKYLPIPIMFFLLMLLNYVVIIALDMDTEKLMRDEIARTGEMQVFVTAVAPLAFFLLMLLVWVKFFHKQSIRSLTTSRPRVSWKRIFFSFFLWGIASGASIVASYYLSPESFELNFQLKPFLILAAVSIVLIPMQTSFEEYLFRGYLMQGLGIATRSRLFPLLFTSIMFGLMHIANPEVEKMGYLVLVFYIGTGLFLGIITLMDEGMELALGFHAANNLVACLLVTSEWSALQTPSVFKDTSEPSAGFDILLPVIIFYPILLIVFAKVFKWTNWKEKLTGKVILTPKNELETTGHE